MIRKEGAKILIPTFLISFLLILISSQLNWDVLWILFWFAFGFFLFSLWFFRDPNRLIPDNPKAIVCPADGKVVSIEEVEDPFVGKCTRVAIFMSILNVHVNRVPISGIVKNVEYIHGKFMSAFKPETSLENERNVISIENDQLRIKVVQIAGIVARRIVSYVTAGDDLKRGERFGMIQFGSRVEIFVPPTVHVCVGLGEKVAGGETIIGEIL
ncbi:MAG: phosphatidylserine decarboxylase family protein [Candidatus Marinimicrobia bacterium CG08_land_8_20_14_0_20_45_22]|nr:MAG: phosphatidylserine decarboxylase family protein [Candidatus Marinimicrobia bacterium CG08_land_8_20_14_0_20_45_22]